MAGFEDFDEVYSMALKFAKEYSPYWNEDTLRTLVEVFLIGAGKVCFIFPGKGMIAGAITPFILDNNKLMATEVAWWVEPEYRNQSIGKELLEIFEDWAKFSGCQLITMVALDKELGKYYKSRGFKLYEQAYMKEL